MKRDLCSRGVWFPTLALALSLCGARCQEVAFDLLIRGGRVADGTGNPAFFADVGIRNGRVVAIGKFKGTAREFIDATGQVVAPGFIDVHTHADDLPEMPLAENFVRMGVTTVVVGNCGGSTLDVEEFFRLLEATNVAVNAATLIGHNSVRRKAMGGAFDRPPTGAEMTLMKNTVATAMKAGAVGLSTGLIYLPGSFSTTDEIIALTSVISNYDGIYASHMRHEDARIFKALEEVARIAREAGVRAHVSHIKLASPAAWGQADTVLEFLERARSEGLDITQDQYAYTASSTGISQLIPDSALEGGAAEFKNRLADPVKRAKIMHSMKEVLLKKGYTNYSYTVIASCRHNPSLNKLNIVQAAKLLRGSDSLDDQVETILQIQENGGASGVFHGIGEQDLRTFMRHPNTMVACDSGIRQFGEGVPHPRGYGNNARVLTHYVREEGVLRLEDAVRKMTSLPAGVFRFKERGLLVENYWADIVVFDPLKIQDTARFEDPHNYPRGISHVLVNGIPVLKDGAHTQAKAGRALRHSRGVASN